jgi:hypothetical protein
MSICIAPSKARSIEMVRVGKQPRGSTSLAKRRDSGQPPTVPKKIRDAAELLVAQPSTLDYGDIAKKVGYPNARMLRRALALPQSVKFLRDYRREMVEHIRMANPSALRQIRDEGENAMAKVQAIRTLEAMGDEADKQTGNRGGQITPGIVIIIEQPGGRTTTIGPRQPPLIEHEAYAETDGENSRAPHRPGSPRLLPQMRCLAGRIVFLQ